tara:strand:+ start:2163 stop:3029 length:867 start_codon:yes stop_codon:yes gene_type:complete
MKIMKLLILFLAFSFLSSAQCNNVANAGVIGPQNPSGIADVIIDEGETATFFYLQDPTGGSAPYNYLWEILNTSTGGQGNAIVFTNENSVLLHTFNFAGEYTLTGYVKSASCTGNSTWEENNTLTIKVWPVILPITVVKFDGYYNNDYVNLTLKAYIYDAGSLKLFGEDREIEEREVLDKEEEIQDISFKFKPTKNGINYYYAELYNFDGSIDRTNIIAIEVNVDDPIKPVKSQAIDDRWELTRSGKYIVTNLNGQVVATGEGTDILYAGPQGYYIIMVEDNAYKVYK